MVVLKTKDTADALGVSPTTVKRWVLHFSRCFQKDRLGHYVFSEQDVCRLQYIKSRIEQGSSLEQIELPTLDVSGSEKDSAIDNEIIGNVMNEHAVNEKTERPVDEMTENPVNEINKHAVNEMTERPVNEINKMSEYNEAYKINKMNGESAELMSQIRQIEYALAHKADEVVSTQVLQHRMELDELRRIVEQLALTVEALQKPMLKPLVACEEPSPPSAKPHIMPPVRHKKRGLLRSLFQFL